MIFAAPGEADALAASGRREEVLAALRHPLRQPNVPASVYAIGFPGRSNHRVLSFGPLKVAYSLLPEGHVVIDHVGTAASYARRLGDPSVPSQAPVHKEPTALSRIQPTHWILVVAILAAAPRLLPFWWSDEFYSVGFLVAPWALWAILRMPRQEPAPETWRMAALAATGLLVVAGWFLRDVMLSLWGIVAALALHALESGNVRKAWIPAALLAVTVPPPGLQEALLWSQKAVAVMAEGALEGLGLPVVRRAFLLEGPNHTYAVEPLCTGLSGVLASVLLVGMTANHLQTPRRAALIALATAILGTILLNVERIVLLVAITEVRGPSLIQGAFHEGVGLALSLVAFAAAIPFLVQHVPRRKRR